MQPAHVPFARAAAPSPGWAVRTAELSSPPAAEPYIQDPYKDKNVLDQLLLMYSSPLAALLPTRSVSAEAAKRASTLLLS